jgi:hypothetical protein
LLGLSAFIGASLGFVLALAWHVAHLPLSPAMAHAPSARAAREPLPIVPVLDHARAVPERDTAPASFEPAPAATAARSEPTDPPPGYIAAEVDSETARRFENKRSRRRPPSD